MTGGGWPSWLDIWQTLTLQAGYNTRVVMIAVTLLGVAAGIVGSFALLRKRSLVADALSHATLPGICLAFMLGSALGMNGRSLPLLLLGATVTGVAGMVCITLITRHTRLREDASIGIVLSVFFGLGIVLVSMVQYMSTGSEGGIMDFIYGQTAAMRFEDAVLMGAIALVALTTGMGLVKEFAVVCFNDDYASVTGWPVLAIDLLLMGLVVLVTVAGIQAVGLILVIAVLIIPPAAARFWTDHLRSMVVLSAVIGGVSCYAGAAVSALLDDFPAGAVIVLTTGAFFAFSMLAAPRRGVLAVAARRAGARLRIAEDHLVKAIHQRERAMADPPTARTLRLERGWSGPTWWLVAWRAGRRGLIERRVNGFHLTAAGRREGARVDRNHRLWEQYLVTYADIAPSHVDWSADMVEHVLSPEIVESLERLLETPT